MTSPTKKNKFQLPSKSLEFVEGAKISSNAPEVATLPPAEPIKTAQEALKAPPTVETPAEAEKTPPAAVKSVSEAENAAPWDDLTGIKPKNHLLVLDPLLWAKMNWLCDNMPGRMSQQKLVRQATELHVNALIEKFYKP